jgi:hypothetical protein
MKQENFSWREANCTRSTDEIHSEFASLAEYTSRLFDSILQNHQQHFGHSDESPQGPRYRLDHKKLLKADPVRKVNQEISVTETSQ